jgi:23S rRNA (cytosine1962-C5)-methyltransferase
MIEDTDPAARPGDIVNVYDRGGQLFGRAMYNPRSKIALRMLVHGEEEVNEGFWRTRLASAIALRTRLGLESHTDAYRLVHAEGDALSGLIVERYADTLVFEIFSLGIFQRLDMLQRLIAELLPPPSSLDRPERASASWRVIVRADESVEQMEGFRIASRAAGARETRPPSQGGQEGGEPGEAVQFRSPEYPRLIIREHGIRYRVDPTAGHKTGFFCDQRDNRKRFAELCKDADVLDLCCYTGGFSLCAKLLGQAREVTAVDLDESALAIAKENAKLNQARLQFAHADAFLYLRQMNAISRQFDCVVLDPPKLAASRLGIDEALRKYNDLNALALLAVKPGGFLVTCSCSGLISPEVFSDTVFRAAARVRKRVQLIASTGAAPDHPILPTCPESAYLKVLWLRVMP